MVLITNKENKNYKARITMLNKPYFRCEVQPDIVAHFDLFHHWSYLAVLLSNPHSPQIITLENNTQLWKLLKQFY